MALNTHSCDLELSSSQYLTNGTPTSALQLSSAMSAELWVKFESFPNTTNQYFISMRNTSDSKSNYLFYFDDASNRLSFFHRNSSAATDSVYVSWNPSTGVWYHVAFTIASSTLRFYVGGSQLGANQSLSNAFNYSSGSDLFIGSIDGTNQYLDGKVDEIRIWNDQRSASEINDNKDDHIDPDTAGLAGYWRLNEDYTDEKGSNNLTAVNSPVFSTDVPFEGSVDAQGGFLLNMV